MELINRKLYRNIPMSLHDKGIEIAIVVVAEIFCCWCKSNEYG
jgi:hypothetical protein